MRSETGHSVRLKTKNRTNDPTRADIHTTGSQLVSSKQNPYLCPNNQ